MRALLPRLLFATALVASAIGCDKPAAEGEGEEGEGEEGEGEGEEGEGEGEEGEGEEGEGEGEGEVPVDGFDVTLDVLSLEPSLQTRYRSFAAGSCEVAEGCVVDDGNRAILSVELVLKNAGTVAAAAAALDDATCGAGAQALPLITARLVARDGSVALEHDLEVGAFGPLAAGARIALTPATCALLDITDVTPGDYRLELALHAELLGDDVRPSNDVVSVEVVVVGGLDCPSTANICGGVCCPQNTACVNNACALPDIFVDEEALIDSYEVQEAAFSADSCAMLEGCVEAPGNRRLLRFSTTTPNDGNADLVMGKPRDRPELFSFSDCHGHFHFDQYADYRLLADDGTVMATGHKQAFCLIDLDRRDPDAGPNQFFCSSDGSRPQGISKGWADTYGKHLDCQWIDITGVPEGNYVLEVHVNPQHIFSELDLMNNVARVPVFIDADPNACVPNPGGEVCHNGEDDDCANGIDDGCAPITTADNCDNGFSIDGNGLVVGEIAADDASSSAPSCGGEGGEFVVHFNVASDGLLYLSTYGSEIDTTLSVYEGTDCQPSGEVFCADDGCVDHGGNGGAHLLQSMTGSPYTAVIKAKNAGEGGRVQLKINQAGCGTADLLADAGDDGDVEGNTDDDRDETSPTCLDTCDGGGRDHLWYFATCPGDTDVRVTTCGPGVAEGQVNPGDDNTFFDSLLELREGGCLGDPVPAACSDDVRTGQIRCSEIETTLRGIGAGDGLWFALVDGCGPQDPPAARGGYELHLTQD